MSPNAPMFIGSRAPSRASQRGVAIILVLLFVVMLVGLIVAFFSKAVLQRQISSSSGNASKVDIFAQGAVDQIVGDLQTEIVAGSRATAAGSGTVYIPSAPTNAMPMLVGSSGSGGLENVVKVSLSGAAFFSGANYTSTGPSRAAAVSSTSVSLNGRYLSTDRWNKALFMPVASATNTTPITTATYQPPDWVLVARDGSNPTTWSAALKSSGTGSSVVVGRYAYTIYHEGGLLDANAVGIPCDYTGYIYLSGTRYSSATAAAPALAYKNSAALIDLSVLNDTISGTNALTAINAGKMVAWRNWSTLGATQTATNAKLTTASGSAYSVYALSNTTGFLTVSGTLNNGQSNRLFTSRQQLIDFIKNTVNCTGTTRGANINVLNYLTTFSRDINQPSFAPDPNRPRITGTDVNDAYLGDDTINPSFLTVRVNGNVSRLDGTPGIKGEPLAKTRFPLNRLAWITYNGPSADNMSSQVVMDTIRLLGGNPSDTNDPIYQYVKEGTAQKVYDAFGLSWVPDPNNSGVSLWVYSHQGTMPLTSAASAPKVPIKTLNNGANTLTDRDPDFFELLRAAYSAGGLGKSYTVSGTSGNPNDSQGTLDHSVTDQIIQIGANIIDQFDVDSYPTRILFNSDAILGRMVEHRGVEDMPYLNRVREAKLLIKDCAVTGTDGKTYKYGNLPLLGTINDPGQAVDLYEPEIWNPHAVDMNPAAYSNTTTLRPTDFRIVALTTDPAGNDLGGVGATPQWRGRPTKPSNPTSFLSGPTTTSVALTSTNTELLFSIPSTGMFREPTLLVSPNLPTGSNLQIGTKHLINVLTGTTCLSCTTNAATPQQYVGFVMSGASYLPLTFSSPIDIGGFDGNDGLPNPNPATAGTAALPTEYVSGLSSNQGITYQIQYKNSSGAWITYDEKYTTTIYAADYDYWHKGGGWGAMFDGRSNIGTEGSVTSVDPRTSRFGMCIAGKFGLRGNNAIPKYAIPTAFLSNTNQMALETNRPDETVGHPTSYTAWYNHGGPTVSGWTTNDFIYLGLLSQNNPGISISGTAFLFADPDGVVRRGMSAYTLPSITAPSNTLPATTAPNTTSSLPLKQAYNLTSAGTAATNSPSLYNASSRPVLLNRPFRSVAELGMVFSDTPWRNLDFNTPESASAALLDVFCITEPPADTVPLVAGKVNLNTRQIPVLQTILTSTYLNDCRFPTSSTEATTLSGTGTTLLSASTAKLIASALVNRTSGPSGPLANISELVGKWPSNLTVAGAPVAASGMIDGGSAYSGFSGTAALPSTTFNTTAPAELSSVFYADGSAEYKIQKFRETAIRAFSNVGQTRVWNLMIDVTAQVGRYPRSAAKAEDFLVEGESHFWVHVAIDRLTGKVVDKQIEVVKE